MRIVRKKKLGKEPTELEIEAMFKNKQVIEVNYLDRTEEMEHVYNANRATNNEHYKLCTSHNYRQMRDNPKCELVITNEKIIARNNYNDRIFVLKKLVDKYNIHNLPVGIKKVPLLYNLFELQDFKQP